MQDVLKITENVLQISLEIINLLFEMLFSISLKGQRSSIFDSDEIFPK